MLDAALGNLLSAPVLAFLLGVTAAALRSDLKLPDALSQALSIYLLLAIGLKGGIALRDAAGPEVLVAVAVALALGLLIPLLAHVTLRLITPLGGVDRGAIAAHYGSTSLVTFTAALVFLEGRGFDYPEYAVALLVLLEIPGIIVGIMLARRHLRATADDGGPAQSGNPAQPDVPSSWLPTLRELLTGKSVILLVGGLAIGAALGERGFAPITTVFTDGFRGALVLFLLGLGIEAGHRLSTLRAGGLGLPVFAVTFPFVAGTLGVVAGSLVGMSVGAAVVLGILCASASYIAAPAAVRMSLPQANPTLSLAASIGITFPVNLILGIPAFLWMAQQLAPVV
jgi:hypothetical protein